MLIIANILALDSAIKHGNLDNMSKTPRTDAARNATLTPEYQYEGAEDIAWEWARKLERENLTVEVSK